MPNQTPNLNLTKPLQTEYYNIDVHNANSDIIDNAIGSINTDKSDKLTAGNAIILTKDTVAKTVNVAVDPTYPANKLANALTINGQQFDGSIAKEITGLATDSSVDTKISNHNTDSSAHANIVSNLESELSIKVNTSDFETNTKNSLNATGEAPIYACRAWINFDGTGTVSIRASGNISGIIKNETGGYTINFEKPFPDANYSVGGTSSSPGGTFSAIKTHIKAAGSYRFYTLNTASGTPQDATHNDIQIFR